MKPTTPPHPIIARLYADDVHLLWGVGVPFFVLTLCIAGVLVLGAMWLVPVVLAAVLVACVLAVRGFYGMLDDEDGDS